MSDQKRTAEDEADLRFARQEVHRLRRELQSAEIRSMLHEAARGHGERPPKHVRGIASACRLRQDGEHVVSFHRTSPDSGGFSTSTGYCIRTKLTRFFTLGRWEWR